MTLQELSITVADLLTQHDASTPVAGCSDILATVELTVVNVGGVKKIVVIQKDA